MKKKNGFTLVELLAVIVVLAIIMIIAIPNVLKVMNSAKKSTFVMYVEKVVTAVQTQYMYDANGGSITGAGYYVYDVTKDLDLSTTGSYKGYVVVDATKIDQVKYIVTLYDDSFELLGYNITDNNMPEANNPAIEQYNATKIEENASSPVRACVKSAGTEDVVCYNRSGYILKEATE